jgi:AraC-like DNA-binding protein
MTVIDEIPISAAAKTVNAALASGVAPEALCRAVGLDLSALEDADHQIPFAQLIRLTEHGARLTGDDAFGLRVGEAQLDLIRRKLGLSARTLQRKLQEEGTSYQELLEETQRTLAEFYLQKPEIAICEVSYLLGFAQPSAFHRAFRRWTGLTPGEFRQTQQQ